MIIVRLSDLLNFMPKVTRIECKNLNVGINRFCYENENPLLHVIDCKENTTGKTIILSDEDVECFE